MLREAQSALWVVAICLIANPAAASIGVPELAGGIEKIGALGQGLGSVAAVVGVLMGGVTFAFGGDWPGGIKILAGAVICALIVSGAGSIVSTHLGFGACV